MPVSSSESVIEDSSHKIKRTLDLINNHSNITLSSLDSAESEGGMRLRRHVRTPSQIARLNELLREAIAPGQNALEARLPPTVADEEMESTPYMTAILTYLSYCLLWAVGQIRDAIGMRLFKKQYEHLCVSDGYAPLTSGMASFYSRRLFFRIRDCWNRPVTGVPGAKITVLERTSNDYNQTFQMTGRKLHVDNLSSYNYLGFAEAEGPCADSVIECLESEQVGLDSSRAEHGTLPIHLKLERQVAQFVGKEDAMIFGMGFATNSTMIPSLVSKGCLIISDELNHTSLVVGCRLSGAIIRTFKHNDIGVLEQVLRESISQGQPRTHRPWRKILVIVEGLYSMEGTIVRLPAILNLRKKYKVNL